MGFGGIGIWQLLIVFVIALLIFGTSRLKTLGSDLGGAIKGFRRAMENDDGDESGSSRGSIDASRLAIGEKPDADHPEEAAAAAAERRA